MNLSADLNHSFAA
jgi:hypothetical protein